MSMRRQIVPDRTEAFIPRTKHSIRIISQMIITLLFIHKQ